jgi:hypothetical protein
VSSVRVGVAAVKDDGPEDRQIRFDRTPDELACAEQGRSGADMS